ncbi:IclR family transcriptional regulator [Sporomusa termitida]|uniref:Glycerol operon regulatory protein n=1 Tax=Sporomusa termitida TaxID=2377 RepID=A0A517DP86_9FIRM|nr:IclR family transcriptional regulator [Sporomusa termitida]QDR79174.1 Transcriptional regulator KdgR [Sporomusa termitida]
MSESVTAVHSVEKSLKILETLSRVEAMGISELSRELGWGKGTVHRIITTLRIHGYVEQTANEKYKLSFKLFELGNRMVNHIGIRKTAHPYLEQLAGITNETVNLAVLDFNQVIYIDRIESREPLRMGLDVGTRFPAYCTALGLAILAYLDTEKLNALLAEFERQGQFLKYTDKTVVELPLIREQLATVRQRGYSIDDEYYLPGIRGVAAPVFNHSGTVKAAISVAGPAIRMTEAVMAEFMPVVKETANRISVQLGYSG